MCAGNVTWKYEKCACGGKIVGKQTNNKRHDNRMQSILYCSVCLPNDRPGPAPRDTRAYPTSSSTHCLVLSYGASIIIVRRQIHEPSGRQSGTGFMATRYTAAIACSGTARWHTRTIIRHGPADAAHCYLPISACVSQSSTLMLASLAGCVVGRNITLSGRLVWIISIFSCIVRIEGNTVVTRIMRCAMLEVYK